MQNAHQRAAWDRLRQRVEQVEALAFAIVDDRFGQDAAMAPMGDEGLEDPALHHALDRAHRQTQGFGRLAGADINLWILGVVWIFHRGGAQLDRLGCLGLFEGIGMVERAFRHRAAQNRYWQQHKPVNA